MIEVILDASQLEVVEACPYKWFMDQVCNLTVRRTNPALSTGSFYHEVWKYYYSRPVTPATPRSSWIPQTLKFAEAIASHTGELTPRLIELGVRSTNWPGVAVEPQFHIDRLKGYVVTNMIEDDASEVIAVEQGFSTLLYEDTERRYLLEGMIDMVSVERDPYGLTVTDHKTQSRTYDKYEVNHQALNYMSFTGANYFRYNYCGLQQKQNPDTFRRIIYKPVEGILEQWRRDVLRTFHNLANIIEGMCYERAINPTDLFNLSHEDRVAIGREGVFDRRRAACDTKFGVCQFHRRCEVPDDSKWVPTVLQAYKEKDNRWRAWS